MRSTQFGGVTLLLNILRRFFQQRDTSMRVPLSWLKDFVEITVSLDDLVHRLTMAGRDERGLERRCSRCFT